MLHQLRPLLLFFNESGGWCYVERPSTPPRALSIQSCAARCFKHPSLSASQAHHHGDPAHSGLNWSAPLKTPNHLQTDRAGKQWWETLKHTYWASSEASLHSKQDWCIFGSAQLRMCAPFNALWYAKALCLLLRMSCLVIWGQLLVRSGHLFRPRASTSSLRATQGSCGLCQRLEIIFFCHGNSSAAIDLIFFSFLFLSASHI